MKKYEKVKCHMSHDMLKLTVDMFSIARALLSWL